MSIRTTVTLDDDVVERVKAESRSQGKSFKETLNELVRIGLLAKPQSKRQPYRIKGKPMGLRPGINLDKISELIEFLEGPLHR